MKLRITQNSIRIRVQRTELSQLDASGSLMDQLQFPGGNKLDFGLKLVDAPAPTASFEQQQLLICLPEAIAKQWITTQQVGIEENVPLNEQENLHLLIEKDFPCADRPNEDKSETFWELSPDHQNKSC